MDDSRFRKPETKPKVARYWKGKEPNKDGNDSNPSSDSENGDIFAPSALSVSKFTLNPSSISVQETKVVQSTPKSVVIKSGTGRRETATSEPPKETALVEEGAVEVITHRRRKAADNTPQVNSTEETPTLGKRAAVEEPEPTPPVLHTQSIQDELIEGQEIPADDEEDDEEDVMESDPIYTRGEGATGGLTRPIYIRPEFREEQARLEELEKQRRRQEEQRVRESLAARNQQLAIEVQQANKDTQEVVNQLGSDSDRGLLNDSTEEDEVSYNKWKVRELKRIKRDREEQEKTFKEKEATERRRMMTDEERAQEDKKIGKYKEDMKSSYRFMQKFYEVGIYNRDDDDPLFKRDYNIAVGEDLFDKSVLPTVKHFRRGEEHKKGKSKYTHLVAEDTTNFDPEWLPFETIRDKQKNMTAGYKNANSFDRPGRKKL